MTKLTFGQKRIGAGIVLAIALLCGANWFLGLQWFGNYGEEAFVVAVIIMFFYAFVIGPSKQEIEDYLKKKER